MLKDARNSIRGLDPNLDDTEILFDKVVLPENDFSWGELVGSYFRSPEYAQIRDTKIMLDDGQVCQNGIHLRFATGCIHQCAYCSLTKVVRIFLNLEEYPKLIDLLIKKHPENTLFFTDAESDLMCLEPEYGVSEILINHFASIKGKFINLTTKSANVNHLLNLEHGGNAIIS